MAFGINRKVAVWSAAALIVGVGVGILIGAGWGGSSHGHTIMSLESRYAHVMFCFAPPDLAQGALQEYLSRLPLEVESSDILMKERVLAQASLAAVLSRQGDSGAAKQWQAAEEACRRAKYADCSRAAIGRLAEGTCPTQKPM
jgi:hypothetical protein